EARARAARRLGDGRCNAEISAAETRRTCTLDPDAEAVLAAGRDKLGLSGRGWDRALRVARTIADLAAAERIEAPHVGEALGLRRRGSAP
ncbi:MAG: magnesium chelatase subunit ChlI family protein, partial [Solirubrobacterales bacterium]